METLSKNKFPFLRVLTSFICWMNVLMAQSGLVRFMIVRQEDYEMVSYPLLQVLTSLQKIWYKWLWLNIF